MTKKKPAPAEKSRPRNRTESFEKALKTESASKYLLKLYVAGSTPRSVRAIENIKRISEEYLHGRYKLEVIDIYQQPELAAQEQLVVAPTLIKKLPVPLRTFIGDLSQTDKILVGLEIRPKGR